MTDDDLKGVLARLQRLEDREAIRDTWLDYCNRLDSEDWNGLGDVFTEDGVLEMVSRNEAKRHDPLETLEWLGTLPDGPDLSGAGNEAFIVWVSKDKEAARSWLGAASPSARGFCAAWGVE